MHKCVFIGGKQIGKNCLELLLKYKIKPALVIGNKDDQGKDDSIHESTLKFAKNAKLKIIAKPIKDPETIKAIQNISPEIIFQSEVCKLFRKN